MPFDLTQRSWWGYLQPDLKNLFQQSVVLLEKVEKWEEKYHDYAFVVFPAAKGFEGFLKHVFLDLEFITQEDFSGKRFRVGKALNPALELRFRGESVYDRLVGFCKGEDLARQVWDTWKLSRNLLFHWFPNEKNSISLTEAKDRLAMVFDTMDALYTECRVKLS